MTYQLRFESNAFRADSSIGRVLDALGKFRQVAQRAIGRPVQEYQGDELRQLRGINVRTFERAMDWADANFDQQMTTERWAWKGPEGKTRRKNGQVVDEPRDIVDTGALLQSKRREVISSSITEFIWDDPVAGAVHDGAQAKGGGMNPARPWTEPTLEEIDQVIDSILSRRAQ
jgi:hypothetical protein